METTAPLVQPPAQRAPQPLATRVIPVLVLLAICWVAFIFNNLFWHGHLLQYGIRPRQIGSLTGILWAPFLHVSFRHLAANTIPLLMLGGILCLRSPAEFLVVTAGGTVLGGLLTWLAARPAVHIGASGLIFCFFGYLASLACFRRTFGTLVLSIVCIVAYGGILRGVLPTTPGVSWEGHLAGFLAGIAIAWATAKVSPQKSAETTPV
jgi:membrane associated rhomboid family serine protease